MLVINSDYIVYVDIDNTLVTWHDGDYYLNKPVLDLLKEFHARGQTVIGWSAGGSEWARLAITRFKLEKYFTLVISKPNLIVDDLPASSFIPEHNRIDPATLKGVKK